MLPAGDQNEDELQFQLILVTSRQQADTRCLLPAANQNEEELQFQLILDTSWQHCRCIIPQAVNTV